MFYWLYEQYAGMAAHIPLLNLLKYLTVRIALALATSWIVAVALGSRFIRWMRSKQGKGQPIREDGPAGHLLTKKGTPTMGGLMILAGITVAVLLWADLSNPAVWVVFGVTLAFGGLGFIDDYAKVTKQSSAGLSSIQKLIAQTVVAVVAVWALVAFGPQSPTSPDLHTSLAVPVFKNFLLNLGWFYVVFGAVVIIGASNAVNLTDGLDGLATVPVIFAAGAFALISYLVGNYVFAGYLNVHFVPRVGDVAVICAAIIGGGMGFLWYNAPPAKIFMGDTGSLALGGGLGAVAVTTKHEIVLAIVGGLFVMEALSVMIQVGYFKLTGKRVFLMAPIHHHFEKLGWAESTVVIRFWIIAALLAMIGLATLKLR
ncbi:phospho-N-acetylmuramoyl-pentapeptide-transferase [Asticcacaulis machinosus]|uniref:Phospho-N-acetylmuramoyl-pentapeptide-transferase n=1 Tax=Asticcacaulis machinosus TaxID=2984211 RepID=A0ABT5HHW2_9CAUL|nr:phospho-N-acetylmuramoyl-pentapeptide-transferase [Asticcacaulis machinosus]MDC7675841.1 phospho-N-acetylmuramoyl-pentapeptide-transferase [Asticcacaulis machinosus]